MIEHPLRIVCTGKGSHDARELALLVPIQPRADLELMGQREDGPVSEPTRRGFGAAEGRRRRGADGTSAKVDKAEVKITEGRQGPVVHVPACPWCGRAPRLAASKLQAFATSMPIDDSGRVELDVSRLPASYS